jgi:hypothetical protein
LPVTGVNWQAVFFVQLSLPTIGIALIGIAGAAAAIATTAIYLFLLRATSKSLQLNAAKNLLDEVSTPAYAARLAKLFARFCDQGFELPLAKDLEQEIMTLIRSYTKIGCLVHCGMLAADVAVFLRGDVCIRLWLMIGPYIRSERNRRNDHFWQWPLQYLTVLSLKCQLGMPISIWQRFKHRTPMGPIMIYHPNKPNSHKTYTTEDLYTLLRDLEREMELQRMTGLLIR